MKLILWLLLHYVFVNRISSENNVRVFERISDIFKSSSNQNIVYLIVNCEVQCLSNAIQLFDDVNSKQPFANVNVISIAFSRNATRPSIFTQTYKQLRESLENLICKSSVTAQSLYNNDDPYSIISKIITEMHQHDSILWFPCDYNESNSRFFHAAVENSKEKQIRINIVWTDERKIPQDYTEMTSYTGGQMLKYAAHPSRIRELSIIRDEKLNRGPSKFNSDYEVKTLEKNLEHDTRTLFSLPEGTFQIYLTIEGDVTKALLISPTGVAINVLPTNDVQQITQSTNENWKHAIRNRTINFHLPITMSPAAWTFSANGQKYAITLLTFVAKNNINDGDYKRRDSYSEAIETYDTNENLQPSRREENLTEAKYTNVDIPSLVKRQDIILDNELNVGIPTNNFLVNYNNLPTIITVDQQSTFYAFPGEEARIVFNVKNNKLVPTSYYFHCYYPSQPCYVQPQYANIIPQQMIPVLVTVKAEGTDGSSNVVSLISQSTDVTDRKVYLHIGKQRSDTSKPDIDYDFNGNCDEADTGYTCQRKQWSTNIYVQDTGSGLLNFWSEPPGLAYTTEFIVGTFDQVSARYSASCCDPKVDIVAVDVRGNTYKRTLDVEHQYLNAIEIIAIVLGSILLLILAGFVIYCLIRWKKKRNERLFLNS